MQMKTFREASTDAAARNLLSHKLPTVYIFREKTEFTLCVFLIDSNVT